MRGLLVTVEGIDGSGKGTQVQLLHSELQKAGIPAVYCSFPQYGSSFFGKEIGAYLRGEFGSMGEVHPKLASLLFAGDRLESKPHIEQFLKQGYVVLCDRYVDSNIAHQTAKLEPEEREDFSAWLNELEYTVFGMPKADITFFLNMPPKFAQQMVLQKQARQYTDAKEDMHEADSAYMYKVYLRYQLMARNWTKIESVQNGLIRGVVDINDEMLEVIKKRYGK